MRIMSFRVAVCSAVLLLAVSCSKDDGGIDDNDNKLLAQTLSFPQPAYKNFIETDFQAPSVSGAQTSPVKYESSDESVAIVDQTTGKVTLVKQGTCTISAIAPSDVKYAEGRASYELKVTSCILPGIFSISATKKVRFSAGNLYCSRSSSDANDWIWNFYNEQYKYNSLNGTASIRTAASTDTEIDLFSYGYSSYATDPTFSPGLQSYIDWGVSLPTLPGNSVQKKIWKTVSAMEWYWLIGRSGEASKPGVDYRKASNINGVDNAMFALVKVNNVCGVMLFPDVFIWPVSGISTPQPTIFNNSDLNNWNGVNYTAAEFETLESAGVVFLPAAGYRMGTDISAIGETGCYQTYSPYSTEARYSFGGTLFAQGTHPCVSVRLACDAQ